MGTWSASITGNDTAQDLMQEYTVAFFKYPVEEALEKLDAWVRANYCDESDPEEWVNYYYSLADFLWRKGILPDRVRDRAIEMIDSRFGLRLWEEAGKSELRQREKVLEKFREKLRSPQPPKKRIKPKVFMSPIFHSGDLVAVQLQTAGKPYIKEHKRIAPAFDFSEEEFHAQDGKYVLMQLIECQASWSSAFAPEIKDWWAHFRLFEGVYEAPPREIDPNMLQPVLFNTGDSLGICAEFYCESSMFWFRKRNYVLVGSAAIEPERYTHTRAFPIYWGINKPWTNPDSDLLSVMGKQITTRLHEGDLKLLNDLCKTAESCYYKKIDDHRDNRMVDDWDLIRKKQEEVSAALKQAAEQGRIYRIDHDGTPMGVLGVVHNNVSVFCMKPCIWGLGYDEQLLRYAQEQEQNPLNLESARGRWK